MVKIIEAECMPGSSPGNQHLINRRRDDPALYILNLLTQPRTKINIASKEQNKRNALFIRSN